MASMPRDICTIFIEDAEGRHQLDDDDLSDQRDSSSSYTGTSCSSASMRVTDRPGWFRRVYFSCKPGISLWISCQRGASPLYGERSKYTLRTYQAVFRNSSYRSPSRLHLVPEIGPHLLTAIKDISALPQARLPSTSMGMNPSHTATSLRPHYIRDPPNPLYR